MNRHITLNRRVFLKSLLGTVTSTTAVSALLNSTPWMMSDAWAEREAPKRLLVLSHCHGWTYRTWKIHPVYQDLNTPWSLDLTTLASEEWSEALSPLFEHRHHMIPIDGLSLASAELDVDGNRHDKGWIHAWTGGNALFNHADTKATTPSIDQRIARYISRPDQLPSVELAIEQGGEIGRPIAYTSSGERLPVENDYQRVWQRLFGPSTHGDQLRGGKEQSLAFAYQEFNQIAKRLSVNAQQKLNTHFELVQHLNQRMRGLAELQCDLIPSQNTSSLSYDGKFDFMVDLIQGAFACDITRVMSLTLGELPTADFGYAHLSDHVHKGLAHEIYNHEDKHQAMTAYLHHHSKQVARLVDRLSNTPDVDGRSIMDNTLIVWGSELADGWHGYQHYCPLLIGGSWYFNMGQYHYMPKQTPIQLNTAFGPTQVSGLPHQHLLTSIAHAFGLTDHESGLARLHSQTGESIDCSGPLSILTT